MCSPYRISHSFFGPCCFLMLFFLVEENVLNWRVARNCLARSFAATFVGKRELFTALARIEERFCRTHVAKTSRDAFRRRICSDLENTFTSAIAESRTDCIGTIYRHCVSEECKSTSFIKVEESIMMKFKKQNKKKEKKTDSQLFLVLLRLSLRLSKCSNICSRVS